MFNLYPLVVFLFTAQYQGHIKLSNVTIGDHFEYQNNISLVPSRQLSRIKSDQNIEI